MNVTRKYLAIDIGGSSIKYAVMNEKFQFFDRGTKKAPHKDLKEFIDYIKEIYMPFKENISGIAISMAGTINPNTGMIMLSGAFDFLRGHNIQELLSCKCPVSIENDANCAALAEINFGSLKGVQDAVVVVLGSSIGGAIILNGSIYYGKHYSAGEFSLIKTNGEDDTLHQLWRNQNGKNGLLRLVQKHLKTNQSYTGIEIFEMAKQGNLQVIEAINEFTHLLAIQLYNVQAAFDPEIIAIGGGISNEPLLFQFLSQNLSHIFDKEKNYYLPVMKPEIVPCKYRNDANLIGALSHFINHTALKD